MFLQPRPLIFFSGTEKEIMIESGGKNKNKEEKEGFRFLLTAFSNLEVRRGLVVQFDGSLLVGVPAPGHPGFGIVLLVGLGEQGTCPGLVTHSFPCLLFARFCGL